METKPNISHENQPRLMRILKFDTSSEPVILIDGVITPIKTAINIKGVLPHLKEFRLKITSGIKILSTVTTI